MNGYGLSNYNVTPKGWDWTDILVWNYSLTFLANSNSRPKLEPYIDDYNAPVLSRNGEKPDYYKGFHQTDVIRIKS